MVPKRYLLIILFFLGIVISAAGDARKLLVGADVDYPPFSFAGTDQSPSGFDIELFRIIAERMNIEPVYFLDEWHQVLEKADSGNVDLVLGAVYSQEREEYLSFSVPYNTIQLALIVPKGSELAHTEDLAGKEMAGLKKDAVPKLYLQRNRIPVTIVEYDTLTEALRLLNEGHHDFAIVPAPLVQSVIKKPAFDNLRVANDNLSTLTYRIGVTGDHSGLLPEINSQIRNLIGSDKYRHLQTSWLPSGDMTKTSGGKAISTPLLLAILGTILLTGFLLFHFLIKNNYTESL